MLVEGDLLHVGVRLRRQGGLAGADRGGAAQREVVVEGGPKGAPGWGESIAASVLFPRYFAHWHACEQYRSCTRWIMPYCSDMSICHSPKGL